MVVASEVYNKYKKDIDSCMARNKLITGKEGIKSCIVVQKVLTLVNKNEYLYYYDDISKNITEYSEVLNIVMSSGVSFFLEHNDGLSSYLVDTNFEEVRYKDTNNRQLILTGVDNTKSLYVNSYDRLILNGFNNVNECRLGYSSNVVNFDGNYVSIHMNDYNLYNCFNNKYYKYVYLSENKSDKAMMECFNNCVIGRLIIDDKNFTSKLDLSSCFKFTSAFDIKIACNSSKINHLINRLTYMRGEI